MTEELAPCAIGAPARKPFEDAVPLAMLRRQNPPLRTRTQYPQAGPDELPACVGQADMNARQFL